MHRKYWKCLPRIFPERFGHAHGQVFRSFPVHQDICAVLFHAYKVHTTTEAEVWRCDAPLGAEWPYFLGLDDVLVKMQKLFKLGNAWGSLYVV